jgi:hypothetical protein
MLSTLHETGASRDIDAGEAKDIKDATKKGADRNPHAYFTYLLTRLVTGWPQKHIDELMPWHWVPQQPP